jgi:hypothetical protein
MIILPDLRFCGVWSRPHSSLDRGHVTSLLVKELTQIFPKAQSALQRRRVMADNEFDENVYVYVYKDPVSNTIEEVHRHHYFIITGKC